MSNESYDNTQQAGDKTGPLFADFAAPSYEEWLEAVDKVLKGAPFAKKLVTKTYEGIDLQPMYRQQDVENLPHIDSLPGFAPYIRATPTLGYGEKRWEVCQELPYSTPQAFNEAARADLERGQNSLNLLPDQATLAGLDADRAYAEQVGQGGVSISSLTDMTQALKAIDLERTPLHIEAGNAGLPITALLIASMRHENKAADKLQGCIGMDPLGALASQGRLLQPLDSAYDEMAELTSWAVTHAPRLQTVNVLGYPYRDAGGSAVQELAFALATAVEYMRELQNRGPAIDDIAPRIRFSFSVGGKLFMEIARLRAARLLWARIVAAFGGGEEAQKMTLHVRTSRWNKTLYDPYVNMLRTTTEAFAGVVGGCDSMHVSPFDEVVGAPDEFSRRIARNTHTVLREECDIARTIDPAGGSWYVETLTDAVARKSWNLFQAAEVAGQRKPQGYLCRDQ